MNTTHYTNFGLSQPPACADVNGYIEYREGYESLWPPEWTAAEVWIATQTERIEQWQRGA